MRDVGTLLEALPYIREFHGRTVVIKYGGAAMTDPELVDDFARDIVLLKYVGMNPVVVHGGGPDITAYMKRLEMPVEFVGGLRVSDEATVEIVKMVLVGKVNKDIVLRLNRHGQPAVGLCGDDGSLLRVRRQAAPGGEDIGFVGQIEKVDVDVLLHIATDYIPVIASVGADRQGNSYNVNADEAAGAIARELGAYKVMFLTDVAGWLRDPKDPTSVITSARANEVEEALEHIDGGHAAEAQGLHRLDPRWRQGRAHRRRARLALPPARALHRRGLGHEDHACGMTLANLQALERDHLVGAYARMPVQFVRGEGTRLWDDEGTEYLDFQTGLAVTSLGHSHPAVVAAIREQATQLIHVGNLFYSEPGVRLAQRLAEGFVAHSKVHFANSGTEANEAALKLARKAKQGGTIISVHRGFHGRTYGSLSATPQEAKQAPFAPLVPGFFAVAPTADAITAAVDERTAAVILEPVQGESGVWVLDDEVLHAARAACDTHAAALIFDEVQCGLGRTGTLWAYEDAGVVPDMITSAKALGGGLPIGALICGPRYADVLEPGDHGSTFAGGPVVCAAAHAVLDVVEDPALLARVRALGERIAAALAELPGVAEVRGRGLMLAADLTAGGAPDLVRRALLEQRLVLNATGPATLRLLPPLTISDADADEALARLRALLETG